MAAAGKSFQEPSSVDARAITRPVPTRRSTSAAAAVVEPREHAIVGPASSAR